ncbi:MAG: hypothetical protein WC783_00320 [Candidatus Paceibacterota bacterium]|jgi:hypothetical protein
MKELANALKNVKLANVKEMVDTAEKKLTEEEQRKKNRHDHLIYESKKTFEIMRSIRSGLSVLTNPTGLGGISFRSPKEALLFGAMLAPEADKHINDVKKLKCSYCGDIGSSRMAAVAFHGELMRKQPNMAFMINDELNAKFLKELKEGTGVIIDSFKLGEEDMHICNACREKLIAEWENEYECYQSKLEAIDRELSELSGMSKIFK